MPDPKEKAEKGGTPSPMAAQADQMLSNVEEGVHSDFPPSDDDEISLSSHAITVCCGMGAVKPPSLLRGTSMIDAAVAREVARTERNLRRFERGGK